MSQWRRTIVLGLIAAFAHGPFAGAQADPPTVPSTGHHAGGDGHKRYFLVGDTDAAGAPEAGFGLLLVLAGGDGGEGFAPFIRNIHRAAAPKGFLTAHLVSVKWTDDQQIIWPTQRTPAAKQRFTTEQFIDAVVADVKRTHKIDDARIMALGWSSSGPALYATALRKDTPVTRFYIAMSVYVPQRLPPLTAVRGRSFHNEHSPADNVCPYRMAKQAEHGLEAAGARVRLIDYDGGHGWHGDLFGRMRDGFAWLLDEK
jgi:predicted esterase